MAKIQFIETLPQLADEDAQEVARKHAEALSVLGDVAILDGHQIDDIAVTTTGVDVAHQLDRKPRGYIVVSRDANAVVYDSAADSPKSHLKLTSSANVTISIWVY